MDLAEAKRILTAFERAGVDYVVIGSMAMAAQGLVRATRDLDFFVSPERGNIDRLKTALKGLYDDDPNVEAHGQYTLDILTRLGEAYRYDSLESEEIDLDGVTVRVATPGMLYRMKRGTIRPQDRLDAEALRRKLSLEEE